MTSLRRYPLRSAGFSACAVAGLVLLATVVAPSAAYAADPPVGLGTAGDYSVLGGPTVTNTGPSQLAQNLGVSPGSDIVGVPPGAGRRPDPRGRRRRAPGPDRPHRRLR